VPTVTVAPGAPVIPRLISRTDFGAVIQCDPTTEALSVTEYIFWHKLETAATYTSSSLTSAISATGFANKQFTYTGLECGKNYKFYCQAKNSVSASTVSPTLTSRIGSVLPKVTGVTTALTATKDSVTVSWTTPTNYCAACAPSGFTVSIRAKVFDGITFTDQFRDATTHCTESKFVST
jgi:hypothetical protein